MSQETCDGPQGKSRRETGLVETGVSRTPENRSLCLSGPNDSALPANHYVTELNPAGISEDRSRSQPSESAFAHHEGRSQKPLMIELFAGLHGWGEGAVLEGYRVIGFDLFDMCGDLGIDRPTGDIRIVLQDVLTIHGRQFKDAALIVASPPCQAYSYRAMPWKKAKALGPPDNSLFEACFRIQREACEAAGHHIPLVVENVRGAQPYVGRSRFHFGSFHLWGDVPALMPLTRKHIKVATMGAGWYPPGHPKHVPGLAFNTHAERGLKIGGWFSDPASTCRKHGAKSPARKRASAMIAKIPIVLSRHIAAAWKPEVVVDNNYVSV